MPACPKPAPRVLTQAAKRRQAERAWRLVCSAVRKRDGGRCRLCFKPGRDTHHIVPRSLGGVWETSNLVTLCRPCHRLVTGHVLKIVGNANQRVRVLTVWR